MMLSTLFFRKWRGKNEVMPSYYSLKETAILSIKVCQLYSLFIASLATLSVCKDKLKGFTASSVKNYYKYSA